ncbi:MAG: DUF3368 domain-containing protein [Verrucomicrobia bacterium]|nr:DUF3368 domain-containing protein [Verrucomicrobiota bacterium]
MGTGGLLLRAKKAGFVSSVGSLMKAMKQNGYFLSDRILDGIIAAAGE